MKTTIKPGFTKVTIEGKAIVGDWKLIIKEDDKSIHVNFPAFYIGLLGTKKVRVTIETID